MTTPTRRPKSTRRLDLSKRRTHRDECAARRTEQRMDITIGEEKIVELESPFSAEEILNRALAKRVDAFGTLAKFMQRPKPEEIEITQTQKRYEPFWHGAAHAVYKYDRRHRYQVSVAPEVQAVTIYEQEHAVQTDHTCALDALEHCEEKLVKELTLEPQHGNERDYKKYLAFPTHEIENLQALEGENTLVVLPEVRSSFLVGKLTQALMKTIQADKIYEQRIEVEQVILYLRPVYAFEFFWKSRDKHQVIEFDALTGEQRAEPGQIKKQISSVLENDDLFDIGSDVVGTFVPGANIAIKLGRLAARKALK